MELATENVTLRDAQFACRINHDLLSCLNTLERHLDEVSTTCTQLLGIIPRIAHLTNQSCSIIVDVNQQHVSMDLMTDPNLNKKQLSTLETAPTMHNLWNRETSAV